jgi:hypothetical protein
LRVRWAEVPILADDNSVIPAQARVARLAAADREIA